jgi:hypothetical protein
VRRKADVLGTQDRLAFQPVALHKQDFPGVKGSLEKLERRDSLAFFRKSRF